MSFQARGYGPIVTSIYPVKKVSGLRLGRVILKILRIVPVAAVLSAKNMRVTLGKVIAFSR